MEMAGNVSNFEVFKENMQPIRQGRNMSVLNVAIAPQSDESLREQRRFFERELRTYNGDDPLDVWCRYIEWLEQSFPKGGKEGCLTQVVEQCISNMKDITKYKNDTRFVEICLKYANMLFTPLEVYNYMYSNNIGTELVMFYEAWAWELERIGNIKRADAVLTEGINRNAQPLHKLQMVQRQFEARIGKAIAENIECGTDIAAPSDDQRPALGNLRATGKKHSVPVNRVGLSQMNPGRPLNRGLQQQHQVIKEPFKLCNDTNVSLVNLPTQSKENCFVPHADAEKENDTKPSKWTKAKVRQKNVGNVPFEAVSAYNKPFEVHFDEDIPESIVTPKKLPEGLSVLSLKKDEHNPPVAIFEPVDPMKRPMYDKFKVYGGAEEFSFEEIRAAKLFAEQKKLLEEKEREEERKRSERMEEQLKLLQEQIEFLRVHINFPLLSENLQSRNVSNEMLAQLQNKINPNAYQGTEHVDTQDLLSCTEKDFSISATPSNPPVSQESGIGECQVMHSSTNHVHTPGNRDMHTEQTLVPALKTVENNELSLELQTEKLPLQAEHSVSGNNSHNASVFSHYGSPSSTPVASLREAMSMVREIYNEHSSFESRTDSFHAVKEEIKVDSIFVAFKDPTMPLPILPSTYASQTTNQCNQLGACLDSGEDIASSENSPPPGYVQEKHNRVIKGILVPSEGIPFIPLEQQLQEDEENDEICPQQDSVHAQLENISLAPLCNNEQFEANAKSASTPFPDSKPLQSKDDITSYTDMTFNLPKMFMTKNINCSSAVPQPNSQCSVQHAVLQEEENYNMKNDHLSVILENSHENYSKSTSSASSNSSLGHSAGSASYFHHTGHVGVGGGVSLSQEQYAKFPINHKSRIPITAIKAVENDQRCDLTLKETVVSKNKQENSKLHQPPNLCSNTSGVFPMNIDPFDPNITAKFLSKLNKPITTRNGYIKVNSDLKIKEKASVIFGENKYHMVSAYAEGSYAKVFTAMQEIYADDTFCLDKYKSVVFKVCMSSNLWEFYICSELNQRLASLPQIPDIGKSVMKVTTAAEYNNAIILVSDFFRHGTLVDLVNCYKKSGQSMPECLVMYFAIEMMHIISKIHQCNIIHGDVKPDNFLLMDVPIMDGDLDYILTKTSSLCLIDFGRAIDLQCFPSGSAFTVQVKTNGFQCPEMRDGLPWTYQTDWFGVLASIHVMLFSDYMNIRKNNKGHWEITNTFKRYWQKDIWESLFYTLLNISSCDKIPDITPFIKDLVKSLNEPSKYRDLKTSCFKLSLMLQER